MATVAAGAAIAVAAFFLGARLRGGAGAPPLVFGRATHVTWDPGLEILPALSPDGRSVAYSAGPLITTHVMVRPVGEGRAIALTGDTTTSETDPEWSPDACASSSSLVAASSARPRAVVPRDPRFPPERDCRSCRQRGRRTERRSVVFAANLSSFVMSAHRLGRSRACRSRAAARGRPVERSSHVRSAINTIPPRDFSSGTRRPRGSSSRACATVPSPR